MSKEIEARLDKMATWAASVNKAIDELRQMKLNVETAVSPIRQSDTASELATLWQRYGSPLDEIRQKRGDLIAREIELAQLNEEIALIENEAALDVAFATDDKGKPMYSNDTARKAAVAVLLAKNDAFTTIVDARRITTAAISSLNADIQHGESLVKEFNYRSRALIARLENETAQLNARNNK